MLRKESLKFVFIGAGSCVFTLGLVGDILGESSIKAGEFVLVDIIEEVLPKTKTAVEKLVETTGRNFTVSTTTDYKQAIPDADFVFMTIATGSYPRWKKDIEICTKYNVLQSVGDTIGPGAIIRTLRTIPVIVDIAHEMEKVCPNAWLINYANPEGAVCLALQKYTKVKNFGLCHGTPSTAEQLAKKVFQVEKERFSFRAAGINHFTWFLQMEIDGVDVYPQLKEKLKESGFADKEPVSAELLEIYGCYPAPGDRHVEEFVPYYLKDEILKEKDYKWKNNDFVFLDKFRAKVQENFEEIWKSGVGYEKYLEGSGETATHFIRSLITGEPAVEMVNVINNGYIDNVSDVIVELPTYIDQFGLHPEKIGRLPDAIAAQCDRLGREYVLMVEAAVECDYNKARQAMFLDPLSANCKYPEQLLNELIKENLDLLPEKWKETV